MVVRDQDLSRAQTRPAVFCINGWAEECATIQTPCFYPGRHGGFRRVQGVNCRGVFKGFDLRK